MELLSTEVIVALFGVLGSAGLWKYVATRARQRYREERQLVDLLLSEVKQLREKVDTLVQDKEDLLLEIATLRSELASAKAELHAMTAALRYGRNQIIGK